MGARYPTVRRSALAHYLALAGAADRAFILAWLALRPAALEARP